MRSAEMNTLVGVETESAMETEGARRWAVACNALVGSFLQKNTSKFFLSIL